MHGECGIHGIGVMTLPAISIIIDVQMSSMHRMEGAYNYIYIHTARTSRSNKGCDRRFCVPDNEIAGMTRYHVTYFLE